MAKLESVRKFAEKIANEAFRRYGVEVLAVPFIEVKRMGFVMFYNGEVVFEVSFLSSTNPSSMFALTQCEAEEALKAFFETERGIAA